MKRFPAVIALSAVLVALLSALMFRGRQSPRPNAAASTPASFDSATVAVSGMLAFHALTSLRDEGYDGRVLLIVVRSPDWRTCEDLGRQLRETLRVAPPTLRRLLVTEPSAVDAYRVFVKREHLRVPVVAVSPDSLLAGQPSLRTPAVLVDRQGNGRIQGISHPRRFPNLRTRSFAIEMDSLLSI